MAGIKLVLDGVIDACTAAMRHPYADGSNAEPIWPLERLRPVVAAADAAGLQVAMHAIGDLASDVALDALEHAHAVNGDRPRRHRIEHLEYAAPETAGRMAALGVTASMQPVHADPAIWANWAAMLGDERADRGFAWTEFREAGALLAFSTDAPTAPHEALPNLYIAATRRSALDGSYPANHPEYALPLADAIAHATRDAAASCLEEHERGRIAPGLAADFAVLDRDPFTEGADVLLEARVVQTVVAGVSRYRADRRRRRHRRGGRDRGVAGRIRRRETRPPRCRGAASSFVGARSVLGGRPRERLAAEERRDASRHCQSMITTPESSTTMPSTNTRPTPKMFEPLP